MVVIGYEICTAGESGFIKPARRARKGLRLPFHHHACHCPHSIYATKLSQQCIVTPCGETSTGRSRGLIDTDDFAMDE
jgi:hypothetical protein